MPRFNVTMRRSCIEEVTVEVDADDFAHADKVAHDQAVPLDQWQRIAVDPRYTQQIRKVEVK
jgi:hypothetical protein